MFLAKRLLFYFWVLCVLVVVFSCTHPQNDYAVPGVSKGLAEWRKANVSSVNYKLDFTIPEDQDKEIRAQVIVSFDYKGGTTPLLLDFNSDPTAIKKVVVNGNGVEPDIINEHLLLDKGLKAGTNEVAIEFIAGEQSLNRNPDYLYTLFVPDRASTCFPLFDQPDIKATYELSLTIPASWTAVANGEVLNITESQQTKRYTFARTKPISSYLVAFSAGAFQKINKNVDGRILTMYHRETDSVKLRQNVDEIFEWHDKSLAWLEQYTGIAYPFSKMDFVLIPSFQYGGMEHPGAIDYKAESLLLDPSATVNQQIGRARLIAHEVSHMWFGNLVTMEWFDDVWLKEVFANFMAAKIVEPEFPSIDHTLNFLLSHYPAAYAVDRTKGTHPISQPLDNLKNAGSLYGAIIYQKAPIVMKMLETNIGVENFRTGMQRYLNTYSFENATWADLITILNETSDYELTDWNERWVQSGGMPVVYPRIRIKNDRIARFGFYDKIPGQERSVVAPQFLTIMMEGNDSSFFVNSQVGERIRDMEGKEMPAFVFGNAGGLGYGFFEMDEKSKLHFLDSIGSYNELIRAALWMNYYELMLRAELSPQTLMGALLKNLPSESNALISNYLLQLIETAYWRFYSQAERIKLAPKLEGLLLNLAINSDNGAFKTSYFHTLRNIVLTDSGIDLLKNIWNQETEIEGLILSENDYVQLAQALAIRLKEGGGIVQKQLTRITNPDRKRKFAFITPALSQDTLIRDDFFESLKDPANRENEEWVLEALNYLHHPLRSSTSIDYIDTSLEMVEEIKMTGDIFFPGRWLNATLSGYSNQEAEQLVLDFLYKKNRYPEDLKKKILQSADLLFRAVKVKARYAEPSTKSL